MVVSDESVDATKDAGAHAMPSFPSHRHYVSSVT